LSCYFFGYHFEHHDSPGTPWWRLWRVKEKQAA
jgi:beta-carotene ketolase (CrtW type)